MIEGLDVSATNARSPAWIPDTGALIGVPPIPTCAACIVVPARDEADYIVRTLDSLAAQRDLEGCPLDPASFEVILLANNCRDRTADVARAWAGRNPSSRLHVVELDLPRELAHVGYARRLAMDEACRRLFTAGRLRGVIATTDADTVVSPTWLAATLHEMALGAEAVGGRILVAAHEREAMAPPARIRFLRNVGYWALANEVMARVDPRPGDPWPCHEQFFGASLAITARAYREVGGLPPLLSGEDAALANALRRVDVEIRHSPAVRVHTSGRLDGRTPAGLAALLASWSGLTPNDQVQLVPSASTVVARAIGRRALRALWRQAQRNREVGSAEVAQLANDAQVPEAWLHHALLSDGTFGRLLGDFEQRARWQRSPELVDVRDAIEGLRRWLEPYRRPGAPAPTFARHAASRPYAPPPDDAVRCSVATRTRAESAPLEEIQSIAKGTAPLAPPPQVA
jgi:hypothetical protein